MLPHEREMVKHLKGQPFTLLGINSDASRSALRKIIKDERVTWPTIYGGPPGKNEIATQWNVTGWPTIYVLDHEGIIREKGPRDSALEKAVKKLLKKVPSERSAKAG